jgi:hypothetical protein
MPLAVNPFDSRRLIGTLTEVTPTSAKLNLPNAAQAEGQWLHGRRLGGGEVGEFVVIENADHAILGRIVSVKLPEKREAQRRRGLRSQTRVSPARNNSIAGYDHTQPRKGRRRDYSVSEARDQSVFCPPRVDQMGIGGVSKDADKCRSHTNRVRLNSSCQRYRGKSDTRTLVWQTLCHTRSYWRWQELDVSASDRAVC